MPPTPVPPPSVAGAGSEASQAALHQHLLVEFALALLQGGLKKGIINPRAPDAGEARAWGGPGAAAHTPR